MYDTVLFSSLFNFESCVRIITKVGFRCGDCYE